MEFFSSLLRKRRMAKEISARYLEEAARYKLNSETLERNFARDNTNIGLAFAIPSFIPRYMEYSITGRVYRLESMLIIPLITQTESELERELEYVNSQQFRRGGPVRIMP